jgi:hypothetical protein
MQFKKNGNYGAISDHVLSIQPSQQLGAISTGILPGQVAKSIENQESGVRSMIPRLRAVRVPLRFP